MHTLTPELVYEVLKRFFPVKNDDFDCDYVEELGELQDFKIETEEQLENLLRRRVDEVMEIDRSPMTDFDIQMHSEADGAESVAKRLREDYWFAYPGLLRIALELEFGQAYQAYAHKRDGVT